MCIILSRLISSVQLPRLGKSFPGVHISTSTKIHHRMPGMKLFKTLSLKPVNCDDIIVSKKREHIDYAPR